MDVLHGEMGATIATLRKLEFDLQSLWTAGADPP
jgi:hypothetical protein